MQPAKNLNKSPVSSWGTDNEGITDKFVIDLVSGVANVQTLECLTLDMEAMGGRSEGDIQIGTSQCLASMSQSLKQIPTLKQLRLNFNNWKVTESEDAMKELLCSFENKPLLEDFQLELAG